jgi:hypothetical protein
MVKHKMVKVKRKRTPVEAIRMSRMHGSVTIELVPEDFIALVRQKNLTVIAERKRRWGLYIYCAFEGSIQYYVGSKQELTELKVDIVVPRVYV